MLTVVLRSRSHLRFQDVGQALGSETDGLANRLYYCRFPLASRPSSSEAIPYGTGSTKRFHDVGDDYNRFDIFDLTLDRRRHAPIRSLKSSRQEGASPSATLRSSLTPHGNCRSREP
jgi:hypothetical protein